VANTPEARTQLARLAGDERLRTAADTEPLLDQSFGTIVDGLASEAAASDDVSDTETALQYLEGRLSFFEGLISASQSERLKEALRAKISSW
jgi:hypothetical protein